MLRQKDKKMTTAKNKDDPTQKMKTTPPIKIGQPHPKNKDDSNQKMKTNTTKGYYDKP